VAREIVSSAAEQLSQTAAAVVRQLGWRGEVPLALAGGCLIASASYRAEVVGRLRAAGVHCEPVACVAEPAAGAVRLAGNLWPRP
jgi:hypothetical protein